MTVVCSGFTSSRHSVGDLGACIHAISTRRAPVNRSGADGVSIHREPVGAPEGRGGHPAVGPVTTAGPGVSPEVNL